MSFEDRMARKNHSAMAVSFIVLSLFLSLSCDSRASRTEPKKQEVPTATSTQITLTDEQLMSLVKQFAAEAGNESAILQEISRYPRTEVINHLSKLYDALPEGEFSKVEIAFLLCSLDYEPTTYKAVIVKAFIKEPHSKNNDADWEADLLQRLIKKGHSDLVPELLRASEWSDGALSESLSSFYVDQLRTAPQDFVRQLSQQPASVRRSVCFQIRYGEPSKDDLKKFNRYLATTSDPKLKSVGQAILTAIRRREN